MSSAERKKSFKAVFIPADMTEEIREVDVPIAEGKDIEAMTEFVKAHIKKTTSVDSKEVRDAIANNMRKVINENPSTRGTHLTHDMINTLVNAHTVDQVPLLVNKKAHDYIGVSMYVDDNGMSKKLPVNQRATAICLALRKRIEIIGDCFIGRIYDNDDAFERLDFTMKDLDLKAKWAVQACVANEIEARNVASGAASKSSASSTDLKSYSFTQDASRKPCGAGRMHGCPTEATLRCSRCKAVWYCTVAHQRQDWTAHRANCTPAAAASTSTATSSTPAPTSSTSTTESTTALATSSETADTTTTAAAAAAEAATDSSSTATSMPEAMD